MNKKKTIFTLSFTSLFIVNNWLFPIFMNTYGALFMMSYMLTDLYCYDMAIEFKCHHLFAIHLCVSDFLLNDEQNDDKEIYKKLFIQTEYSTIFLNLYQLSQNNYFLVLFIFFFFYFRIYCLSTFYFYHKTSRFYYHDISAVGLYGLNLYWFSLIIQKIKQEIFSKSRRSPP